MTIVLTTSVIRVDTIGITKGGPMSLVCESSCFLRKVDKK